MASVLWLTVSGVQADGGSSSTIRATSVAEMLLRKQEAQLREQLANQGRWDAVRELDRAQAQRLEAQKKQTLTKINGELAASAPVDTPSIDSMGTLCTPVRAGIPGSAKNFAAGPAANQGTMQVR